MSLTTRQSAAAKQAWRRCSRVKRTMFPFDEYPPIVDFINLSIPNRTRVALLGGGRGQVVDLLDKKRKSFVNLELSEIEDPHPLVQTMQVDIEKPFTREQIGLDGKPKLYLASFFSLEYVDISRVIENGAGVLNPNEQWIVLCHHADSHILEGFRQVNPLLEVLKLLEPIAETDRTDDWRRRGLEAEHRFKELFPGYFPDWLNIFETDPKRVTKFMELELRAAVWGERIDSVFRLFVHLNGVVLGDQNKENAQTRLLELIERFADYNAISERLLSNNFRSPQELEELFRKEFAMIRSQTFINSGSKGFVIGAVFRKS